MSVLEDGAHALSGREAGPQLDVLRQPLVHRDDHGLVALRHVRLGEVDVDAGEDVERGHALLRLADVARAKRLVHLEGDAFSDDVLVGEAIAADEDLPDVDALALVDLEVHARVGRVQRPLERGTNVDEVKALLLVQIDDAALRFLDLHCVRRTSEADVRGLGEALFVDGSRAGEGEIVEEGARAQLHGNA